MSTRVRFLSVIVGLAIAGPNLAANAPLPPEVEAVRKYILEKDYPELFQGTHYRVRIANLVVADVDNDGHDDVTVHFAPHYRQSATIVFYHLTAAHEVKRVVEGLAPGPLQPVSGEYLDSHTLGLAVDFSIEDQPKGAGASESLVMNVLKQFGGVVAYAGFFHADSRAGAGAFVDMRQIADAPHAKHCENFEFAEVREIAVGPLKGQAPNVLAAWVGDEIYVYRIRALREDGLLDKDLRVRKAPAGFQGFVPGKGLTYVGEDGTENTLEVDTR